MNNQQKEINDITRGFKAALKGLAEDYEFTLEDFNVVPGWIADPVSHSLKLIVTLKMDKKLTSTSK